MNILFGFGFYSIFFFLFRNYFDKKEILIDIDIIAIKLTIFAGLFYGLLCLIIVITHYYQLSSDVEQLNFYLRNYSVYNFIFCLFAFLTILFTQLLWFNSFKESLIFRIILSTFFIVSTAQLNFYLSTKHRDYIPSVWHYEFSISQIIFEIFIRSILFFLIVIGIYLVLTKFKVFKSNR